ncbi:multicopper oxidase family protein [Reyranella sp.]|uniref:multicopper oxidase family protein n=1 Tax=Reyranella sp. TaxID=1929291 RepID=UPI003BAD0D4B
MSLLRRTLLAATAGAALAPLPPFRTARASGQRTLDLTRRTIEVGGKPATRYRVVQPDGTWGLTLDQGDMFDVRLQNGLSVDTSVHWHGMTPPWKQDGVPYISAPPIAAGRSADFRFPAVPVGTRWMHSHFGLQEQNLLAAPLIVRERSAIESGHQEVVVMFEDFSWSSPDEIFADLRKPRPMAMMAANADAGAARGAMKMPDAEKAGKGDRDLNDVTYAAFLANDRTLADPQVFDVDKGAEVRLRLINGAASTNFMIELGSIEGTVLTVDGNPVAPVTVRRFPLAVAQRVDILVRMPADGSAVPVVARGEGRPLQAGVVLRPRGAAVSKIPITAAEAAPALTLGEEMKLRASQPLPARKIDRSVEVDLTGQMLGYVWGLSVNGMAGAPVTVGKGERVELVMRNTTMMSHPMHLHGHSFQVTEIDGKPLAGALRDVLLVTPGTTAKVVFDADNPGIWAYHCHNLYHLAAGMFTTVVYRDFT